MSQAVDRRFCFPNLVHFLEVHVPNSLNLHCYLHLDPTGEKNVNSVILKLSLVFLFMRNHGPHTSFHIILHYNFLGKGRMQPLKIKIKLLWSKSQQRRRVMQDLSAFILFVCKACFDKKKEKLQHQDYTKQKTKVGMEKYTSKGQQRNSIIPPATTARSGFQHAHTISIGMHCVLGLFRTSLWSTITPSNILRVRLQLLPLCTRFCIKVS